jgi:uncharacterized protein (TIGR00369 family)
MSPGVQDIATKRASGAMARAMCAAAERVRATREVRRCGARASLAAMQDAARPSLVSAADFERIVRQTIPLADLFPWVVDEVFHGRCVLRMDTDGRHVRAGGTVSGPALMTLADTALYLVTLSVVGPEPLAVTSDLSIRFLRKPAPGPILAEARVLRAGKRLVVGEVTMRAAGDEEPAAHVTGAYALPSPR